MQIRCLCVIWANEGHRRANHGPRLAKMGREKENYGRTVFSPIRIRAHTAGMDSRWIRNGFLGFKIFEQIEQKYRLDTPTCTGQLDRCGRILTAEP